MKRSWCIRDTVANQGEKVVIMPHGSVELWSLEDRNGGEEEDARRYPVPGTKNGANCHSAHSTVATVYVVRN